MAAKLPANVLEYTALQAQASFTEAEKKAFKQLSGTISKHEKETLWWYWDLGQLVKGLYEESKAQAKFYGKNFLERQAKALGYSTDRVLRNAMDVVTQFGTKKAFGEYAKMQGEAGNSLGWTHMVYLAGVADDEIRGQLAAATLEQCWTAEMLWDKIRSMFTKKKRGKNTPKAKIPTSIKGCLSNVVSMATKFVHNVDNAWTGDAFDIAKQVADLPADRLSDDFVETVHEAYLQLEALLDRTAILKKVLKQAEVDIDAKRASQLAAEEAAAAEEEELEEIDDEDEVDEEGDEIEELDDVEEDEEEEDDGKLDIVAEAMAIGNDDDEILEAEVVDEDEEEEDSVNLGELRNAQRRELMARRRKLAEAAKKRAGRVGVNR